MGLEGWHGVVREYMRTGEFHSLPGLAEHFNAPLEQILLAIAGASEDDTAGNHEALKISGDPLSIIEAAKHWGLLRAVVRSPAGAISELTIKASDLKQKNDWLTLENEHFHLHVNWSLVANAYLLRRGDSYRGVFFTDIHGQSVFKLSLMRTDKQFDEAALKAFEQNWTPPQPIPQHLETQDQ